MNERSRLGHEGEQEAISHLMLRGYTLLEHNWRSSHYEIDIIAEYWGQIVFVEVKTHIRKSTRASRLWCVDRRKKNILLRACTNWILKNKWHGNFRFDVIQIYGSPHGTDLPEIDHMENVHLFPSKWRFW